MILTRAYHSRMMGKAVSPVCRVCKGAGRNYWTSSHQLRTLAVDALQRETRQSVISDRPHAFRQVRYSIVGELAVGTSGVERDGSFEREGPEAGH